MDEVELECDKKFSFEVTYKIVSHNHPLPNCLGLSYTFLTLSLNYLPTNLLIFT